MAKIKTAYTEAMNRVRVEARRRAAKELVGRHMAEYQELYIQHQEVVRAERRRELDTAKAVDGRGLYRRKGL